MNRNYKRSSGGYMARIYCPHCNEKMLVETNKPLSIAVRDFYCTCTNPDCLARPVMTISHKADRTPPLKEILGKTGMISKMLEGLTDDERKNILEQFNPSKKTA